MAYIGRGIENLINAQKLDVITPSTATGAGPYNLTQNSVAFVPASADALVVSINGVIQYGNFTVNGSTITFSSALVDSDVCDFIFQVGTGLLNTPADGSVTTSRLANNSVTTDKIVNDAITNDKILNESITINGSAVSLGGSITIGETKPTITSIAPDTITNDASNIVITGTNFVITPTVEFHSTTGAVYYPNTVTRNSSTQLTVNATLAVDGTYFVRVENPDGLAVRSSTALLTVSDAPTWTTASGSLGSVAQGASFSTTVVATSDSAITYSVQSGALPTGLTLNTSTGVISGTESGVDTGETVYNFTLRATDAETQTADRAFTITVTVGINNAGQFN
jgi:large repetitive protein